MNPHRSSRTSAAMVPLVLVQIVFGNTRARMRACVCARVLRAFGLTRPGPASLESHRIPRPITGHGSLNRGAHYTESAGHRKPENRICCFTPFAKTPDRLPWPHRVTPSSRSCAAYLSWVSVWFHKPSFRPTRGHIYLFAKLDHKNAEESLFLEAGSY